MDCRNAQLCQELRFLVCLWQRFDLLVRPNTVHRTIGTWNKEDECRCCSNNSRLRDKGSSHDSGTIRHTLEFAELALRVRTRVAHVVYTLPASL